MVNLHPLIMVNLSFETYLGAISFKKQILVLNKIFSSSMKPTHG